VAEQSTFAALRDAFRHAARAGTYAVMIRLVLVTLFGLQEQAKSFFTTKTYIVYMLYFDSYRFVNEAI
jgi:hypothetical protein